MGPAWTSVGERDTQTRKNFGLRMFAPPCGPSDLVRGTRGLHDDLLIGGIEWLRETGQCRLDEPRFQDEPRGLAERIEYPGHSQRLQCSRDAPGSHALQDYVPGTDYNLPEPGFLDYGKGCTGCGSVACSPSAPLRQIVGLPEGRISGSS